MHQPAEYLHIHARRDHAVITRLLDEIAAYFACLQQEHGDYAAFHNYRIPLEGYVARLAPYYINRHPYCLHVKSDPAAWNHCMDRLPRLEPLCAGGAFCGVCYAGMGEWVFPVQDFDGTVLGFISVSGYDLHPEEARGKMRHFARLYGMPEPQLQQVHRLAEKPPPDPAALKARIAPLCNMFVLLYHALREVLPRGAEMQRESSLLSHAVFFLQKNYMTDAAAADVAAYCHCSVSTISHLFKRQMGQSVPAYILTLRLDHARRLLRETGLTVGQISDTLGFCNPNYFCRCFKNSCGLSPSQWRRLPAGKEGGGASAGKEEV